MHYSIDKIASLVSQDLPSDWEILHYSASTDKKVDYREHVNGLIYKSYDEWEGTVCYAASQKGVQKLLSEVLPISIPLDVFIAEFTRKPDRKTYAIIPSPVIST